MPIAGTIGMISQGLNTIGQAGQILGIGQRKQDERQIKQQGALNKQQMEANKIMLEEQRQKEMQMWHDTNYKAQVEEIEKAGLNPALLYGKGGGGGTTVGGSGMGISGGQAANAAATQQANTQSAGMAMQLGMQAAQLELIKAQTEKTKAEAAKTSGVDTQEAAGRITGIEFQNELNKTLHQTLIDIKTAEGEIAKLDETRKAAEWETYVAAGYKGKNFDDPTSPIGKALIAGWEKSVQDLQNAKADGNIKQAQAIIEEYKTNLIKEGLPPDSPWYWKLIGDLLGKINLNPIDGVKDYLKK